MGRRLANPLSRSHPPPPPPPARREPEQINTSLTPRRAAERASQHEPVPRARSRQRARARKNEHASVDEHV